MLSPLGREWEFSALPLNYHLSNRLKHGQAGVDHPTGGVADAAAGGQGQDPVGDLRADLGFHHGIPTNLVEKQRFDPVRGEFQTVGIALYLRGVEGEDIIAVNACIAENVDIGMGFPVIFVLIVPQAGEHGAVVHVVTLEDPIEFLHRHKKSIVSQREIAIDTQDYRSALRACVRQAPDVILLGEMRDPETMHTAMTAAETGHLVIATLHTKGAVNAIDQIIDAFPSTQQGQIRLQLSTVLRTVVSQQLIPDGKGGMVPACEILHLNSAVRSMIRDNRNHQIDNAIAAGGKEGMVSMDQAIGKLFQEGKIPLETALHYADNPEQLKRQIL